MAKTPAQRGPFGNWLKRVREERYRTQAEALAAMRRLAGIALSPSEYSQWEAGSRTPRPDNPKVARLYEFFGSRPTVPLEATESGDALVDAIRAQTKAMLALVAAIEGERAERVAWETGVVASIREVALALARRDGPAHEPHADVLP